MILYKKDNLLCYEDIGGTNRIRCVYDSHAEFDDAGNNKIIVSIYRYQGKSHKNFFRKTLNASDIKDRLEVSYGSTFKDVIFGFNRGMDVNAQDQTTDDVIVKFNKVSNSTTLSIAGSIDDRTLTLTSVAGEAAGKYIILFDPLGKRFTPYHQVGAAVGNVITIDGPLDFDYPSGTFVDLTDTNMAVDGSSTPQIFGLRGTGAPPGVDIDFDMTRITISCLTATAVDLSKFGDLDVLTNGLQFRQRNNRYKNSFNVKTNREIDAIFGLNFKPYSATNPVQGQHGYTAMLTYADMGNIGVSKRLPIGTDFESIVQDNLLVAQSGGRQITLLEIYAEGHIVEP